MYLNLLLSMFVTMSPTGDDSCITFAVAMQPGGSQYLLVEDGCDFRHISIAAEGLQKSGSPNVGLVALPRINRQTIGQWIAEKAKTQGVVFSFALRVGSDKVIHVLPENVAVNTIHFVAGNFEPKAVRVNSEDSFWHADENLIDQLDQYDESHSNKSRAKEQTQSDVILNEAVKILKDATDSEKLRVQHSRVREATEKLQRINKALIDTNGAVGSAVQQVEKQ